MEILKPCPFCGEPGRVTLFSIRVDDTRNRFVEEYRAECINCGANTGRGYRSVFFRKNGEFIFEKDGYTAAAEGWNRRAEDLPGDEAPPAEESEGG